MLQHLKNRPNLYKALINTGWLFADRIVRMGMGLLVGVWVARYLGPEQFGLLSYATAFVALFGAIASLGLNAIVVQDLVKEPLQADITLGTTFVLQLLGGFLAVGLAIFAIDGVRPNDQLIKTMVAALSLTMVFRATETVKYWFEAQIQSKYSVWVENTVFLIIAGIKVVLIMQQAPLMAFVWVVLAEAILVAVILLATYAWQVGTLFAWRIDKQRAKNLLNDSWPLILSGLAIMVYMRIDQIMLGQMLGDESVGIYSAAVRISEVWYFVPTAIVASFFPSIIEAKKQSESLYYQRLQQLYNLMVALSVLAAIPVTFASDWLVTILFGNQYEGAGSILAIHVWAGVFVSLGVASGKWFTIENISKQIFYRSFIGALTNIALNSVLIPKFGIQGCALATLISYSIAAFWFDLLLKNTRKTFFMKIKAFFLGFL